MSANVLQLQYESLGKYSFSFLNNLLQQSCTQAHLLSCVTKPQTLLPPVHSGRTGNLHARLCQIRFTIGRMWVRSSQSPFLSPWSHFTYQTYSSTLWAAVCTISLATPIERKCNLLGITAERLKNETYSKIIRALQSADLSGTHIDPEDHWRTY